MLYLGAVGFGSRGCRLRHDASVAIALTLTLAQNGQEGAQLRHRDAAVVPVARQQVLKHLGRRPRPTLLLTRHLAHREEEPGQDDEEHRLGEAEAAGLSGTAMGGPDGHDFFS